MEARPRNPISIVDDLLPSIYLSISGYVDRYRKQPIAFKYFQELEIIAKQNYLVTKEVLQEQSRFLKNYREHDILFQHLLLLGVSYINLLKLSLIEKKNSERLLPIADKLNALKALIQADEGLFNQIETLSNPRSILRQNFIDRVNKKIQLLASESFEVVKLFCPLPLPEKKEAERAIFADFPSAEGIEPSALHTVVRKSKVKHKRIPVISDYKEFEKCIVDITFFVSDSKGNTKVSEQLRQKADLALAELCHLNKKIKEESFFVNFEFMPPFKPSIERMDKIIKWAQATSSKRAYYPSFFKKKSKPTVRLIEERKTDVVTLAPVEQSIDGYIQGIKCFFRLPVIKEKGIQDAAYEAITALTDLKFYKTENQLVVTTDNIPEFKTTTQGFNEIEKWARWKVNKMEDAKQQVLALNNLMRTIL